MESPEHIYGSTPFDDMMKLFDKLTFRQKWAKVRRGLKQPKTSGEHKWAVLQLQRLLSPAAAVVAPTVAMALMLALAGMAPEPVREITVDIYEDEAPPELEEPEDIPEPEIQPPEPQEIVDPTLTDLPSTSETVVGPDVDFSPQPAEFDSVAIVRSPVSMRGIFDSRSPGARGSQLGRFGGGAHTEGAVLRALRWLKKHQEEDGSWRLQSGGGSVDLRHTNKPRGAAVGITGLGLLTFLAHGETPQSPEFGSTVENAIRFLQGQLNDDGTFSGMEDRKHYGQIIAAYALAEAYGLTQIPTLGRSAETAMRGVLARRKANHGWDYLRSGGRHMGGPDRLDVSLTAWAAQAIKAAQMAGLNVDGLYEATDQTIAALKKCYRERGSYGAFSYRSTDDRWWGLTGAAVLGLQLLGAADHEETRQGMDWLTHNIEFDWNGGGGLMRNLNNNPIYNWYYITQTMFHEGGETWRDWNDQFSIQLVENQTVIADGYEDMHGNKVDIGYWQPANSREWSQSYSYNTTLCALQLMVYYRYLPTFQDPDEFRAQEREPEAPAQGIEAKDLDIDIQF